MIHGSCTREIFRLMLQSQVARCLANSALATPVISIYILWLELHHVFQKLGETWLCPKTFAPVFRAWIVDSPLQWTFRSPWHLNASTALALCWPSSCWRPSDCVRFAQTKSSNLVQTPKTHQLWIIQSHKGISPHQHQWAVNAFLPRRPNGGSLENY